MKQSHVRLNRLLAVARAAPAAEQTAGLSLRLQRRVLAQWRRVEGNDTAAGQALLCRRALACAAIVMMVTVAWAIGALTQEPENDFAIANYELRADVMP